MTEAVLLVGGKGTRLRPLTVHTPKPMLPTAGVPFLHHLLARARAAGVDHVVLATSYRPEVFRDGHRRRRRRSGCGSTTSPRTSRWAPAAASATSPDLLESGPDDPVVMLNGDILSGHDLAAQVAAHQAAGADVTLHLTEVDDPRAVRLRADRRRTAGSPRSWRRRRDPVTNRINAGCYVFRRVGDRRDPGRPAGVGRAGDLPGADRAGRAGARPRRPGVLARPRHAGRLRPRLARPGARRRWRRRRCPARPASRWCWPARRSPPTPMVPRRHDGRRRRVGRRRRDGRRQRAARRRRGRRRRGGPRLGRRPGARVGAGRACSTASSSATAPTSARATSSPPAPGSGSTRASRRTRSASPPTSPRPDRRRARPAAARPYGGRVGLGGVGLGGVAGRELRR